MNFRAEQIKQAFNRRTFLRGIGLGAAGVVLHPILQHMHLQAEGIVPKKRIVFIVKGNGFMGLKSWKKLTHQDPVVETPETLPSFIKAWEPRRQETLMVTGLSNKQGLGQSAGHRDNSYTMCCKPYAGGGPGGISFDSWLSQRVSPKDIFPLVLLGAAKVGTKLAATTSASGRGASIYTQHDPIAAYQELFGAVSSDANAAGNSRAQKRMLDHMSEDIKRVTAQLPSEEKWKMERYLYSVETFQTRYSKFEQRQAELAQCVKEFGYEEAGPDSKDSVPLLKAQFDTATQALVCGLTHVVTMSVGTGHSYGEWLSWGFGGGHAMGHGGGNGINGLKGGEALSTLQNHIAELIMNMGNQLAMIPEGDGTMLDNTLFVFTSGNGGEHHSYYDNVPMALLGNLGGKLNTGGRLIEYPNVKQKNNRGLPEMWNTIAHAMDTPIDDFAKDGQAPSNGTLPEVMA